MRKSTRILALVWVLVLLASPLYAGHSFSDPMRTTGDGDLYVLGGLDVDGTCRLDGAFTFNAGATGDNLTLSGTLAVGGAMSLTDSLYIDGPLTITGALAGARCILPIGSNGTDKTTDQWLKGGGFMTMSATCGYMVNRSGSIVGATCMYNVDSKTDTPTWELEIRVNNVVVYPLSDTVTATGIGDVYGTQARGTDTFVAGDIITAYIDITGTIQYDIYGGYIEVQFDD